MNTLINYNPQTALLLAEVSALTYTQFQKGQSDPNYDGMIEPPVGYQQTAIFRAPEPRFKLESNSKNFLNLNPASLVTPSETVLTNIQNLESFVKNIQKVYFGFTLAATDGSGNCIIALRGTQYPYEWLMDANFIQVPIPLIWFGDPTFQFAKVHFGFLFLYAFLKNQIINAACGFQNWQTCYVTGHSLGAALATLTALTLGTKVFPGCGITGRLQMYNYASPRVGNSIFANAYNSSVPYSYRIVNLADVVPIIPPKKFLQFEYQHIGQPDQQWSYLNQTGDIGDNHNLQNNYIPALQTQLVTNQI